MDKKTVLITGGLGFLGSYCVEVFKKNDWSVLVIDNLSTNVIKPEDPICEGIELRLRDMLQCNRYADYDLDMLRSRSNHKIQKLDLIVHLASPVGPVGILKHSGNIAQQIISETKWVVNEALDNNCPLIFVSSSEIYGYRDSPILLKEDDDKLLTGNYSVRNEYSIAKLLAEIMVSNIAKVEPLKYQIIRPFNISGARQLKQGGFVIPTFVQQALKNEPITVFGTGEQIRAFTHVKDIADGLFLVANQSQKYNQIWNIGNSNNILSILNLAKKIKLYTKSKSEIVFVDPKTIHGPLYEEAWDKIPNACKIQEILGWQPQFDRDDIIKDVIKYYETRIQSL